MVFLRIFGLLLLTAFTFGMGTIPAVERNGIGDLFAPLFFIAAPLLYFLPTIEGNLRKQPNITSIALLNIFLGWTLVGWVVAIVWACKDKPAAVVRPSMPSAAIKAYPTKQPVVATSVADQLTQLATLKEKGMLTDQEFSTQKAKILSQ